MEYYIEYQYIGSRCVDDRCVGGTTITRIFFLGGPYAVVLGVLAVAVFALSVKKSIDLFVRTGLEWARLARGVDAILFWGCIAAVLGFLGQFSASYKSLMVISQAGMLSPQLIAEGIAVSLITTIFGLGILVISAIVWFALKSRLDNLTSHEKEGRTAGV
jgi:hypothetical protein